MIMTKINEDCQNRHLSKLVKSENLSLRNATRQLQMTLYAIWVRICRARKRITIEMSKQKILIRKKLITKIAPLFT